MSEIVKDKRTSSGRMHFPRTTDAEVKSEKHKSTEDDEAAGTLGYTDEQNRSVEKKHFPDETSKNTNFNIH